MNDIVGQLLQATSARSLEAPALAFVVGVIASAGPCLAPRFVALSNLTAGANARHRGLLMSAFVIGIVSSYLAIAWSVSLFVQLTHTSSWIYLGLAGILMWLGLREVLATHNCLQHTAVRVHPSSFGAAWFMGASGGLIVSPCCTPFAAAVAGIAEMNGARVFGLLVTASFAVGHALPVVLTTTSMNRFIQSKSYAKRRPEIGVLTGAVMIALGCYFGLVA